MHGKLQKSGKENVVVHFNFHLSLQEISGVEYEIWDFHSGDYEYNNFLRCDAV
jgi:hypothetical protein